MQANLTEWLSALPSFLRIPVLIVAAMIVGWIIVRIALRFFFWNIRRWDDDTTELIKKHVQTPASYVVPLLLANVVLQTDLVPDDVPDYWSKLLIIFLIIMLAWLGLRIIDVASDIIRSNYRMDVDDNLDERKLLTQLQYIRRVSEVVLFVIALALILLQFEGVRKIGTGILTSAGVAGIIIGFAAQKSIANLLAGFQIAFTQPIRIDDVVIVEGEWGRIEEITLTYVVVRIWDQRRLVVPLHHFIDKAFQNWTRITSELLGTVFLYVDYTFPVEELRQVLKDYLEKHKLWDKRVSVVQVTDAKPDVMEIRLLVSAGNAGNAFDLRCDVREYMIRYIQENYPESLPRGRVELAAKEAKQPLTGDAK
jgi:small-conductance mechanosensitive channel